MEQILGVRQNLTFLGCWWAKDIFRRTVHIVQIVQIVLHNSKNNCQQVVGGAGVTFLLALRITVVGCLKETSWDDFWNSLMFRWRLWGCSKTNNAAAAMRPGVVVSLDARFVSLSVRFFYEKFSGHVWYRHDGGDRHMDGDSLLVGFQVKRPHFSNQSSQLKKNNFSQALGRARHTFFSLR